MKRIVTALFFVIALGREGHPQSELKVIPESEVPNKILTHFKTQFTQDKAKWSRDTVHYQVEYEKKDANGKAKLSFFIGYDTKTGEAEFMQNAIFNIDLSADMQLMSAVARGATGFNIFIDMGNRIGVAETSKKLNFLLHSLKPEGDTYVLHLTDNKGNLMVTYDQNGKVLKEERK